MKRVLFISLILFCPLSQAFSQTKLSKIIAAYQWCPFPCESINLNPDFTFNYRLDGDLFNGENNKGIWKFVGKNKIYLKTNETPLTLTVEEKIRGNSDKIKIQTLDPAGAIFPNIEIWANEIKHLTDENGTCEIPKTSNIRVSYANQNAIYKLKDKNSTELEIIINDINWAKTEGTFVIRKNEICRIGDNPNDLTCFRKLKKATKLKLFPSKS